MDVPLLKFMCDNRGCVLKDNQKSAGKLLRNIWLVLLIYNSFKCDCFLPFLKYKILTKTKTLTNELIPKHFLQKNPPQKILLKNTSQKIPQKFPKKSKKRSKKIHTISQTIHKILKLSNILHFFYTI